MSDDLSDDEKKFEATLKDGTKVDCHAALSACRLLEFFLQRDPKVFAALRDAANSGSPYPLKKLRKDLRFGLIDRSGMVRPISAAILRTSIVETSEGIVIALPFLVESESQRLRISRLNDWLCRRYDAASTHILDALWRDEGQDPSPSR